MLKRVKRKDSRAKLPTYETKQFENVMRNFDKYTEKNTWFVLNSTSTWFQVFGCCHRRAIRRFVECFHFYWKGNKWWAIPKLSSSFSIWHFIYFFSVIFQHLSVCLHLFRALHLLLAIIHSDTKSLATSHSSRQSIESLLFNRKMRNVWFFCWLQLCRLVMLVLQMLQWLLVIVVFHWVYGLRSLMNPFSDLNYPFSSNRLVQYLN